jgi:BirA family biotin operon repressor/biotin-[acetyl-CoA-carboxylase] ligase
MDEAKALVAGGAPDGSAVRADAQTEGRGRRARRWHSPAGGGLWFSILATPDPADRGLSLLATALAVCETVPIAGAGIRWPNDVVAGTRKLAGVIGEECDGRLIVGVGLNTNLRRADMPPEIRDVATSVLEETGTPADNDALFASLLPAVGRRLADVARGAGEEIVRRVRDRSVLLGHHVVVERGTETLAGVAEGIGAHGELLLSTGGRLLSLSSGEITRLR